MKHLYFRKNFSFPLLNCKIKGFIIHFISKVYAADLPREEKMYSSSLILEGGGMRGVYTAGVLDYFMERKLELATVYGVSAGALNGANYKSRQIGRSINTFTGFMGDKRYSGPKYLLTTGDWFNKDFVYGTIPNLLDKVDWEGFRKSPTALYAVLANVRTGRAEYKELKDVQIPVEMDILRASASLPILSKPVHIDGEVYLDGGICDSIPLRKSIADGHAKNVVILTRDKGYVKTAGSNNIAADTLYRKYPNFRQAMKSRHIVYNSQVRFVHKNAADGKAFVIQPKEPVSIGRLEKDKKKLWTLYHQGFNDAKECYDRLIEFLES